MQPQDHLSFSVWVNNKPVTRHGFDGIQRRSRLRWVDDAGVNTCCKCSAQFGLFIRKHHCRWCAMIFCDGCSARRAVIPEDIPIPEPSNGVEEDRTGPLRVCDDCFVKLYQLRRCLDLPEDWSRFTAFMDHVKDVRDLKTLSLVCKEWNKISNYYLSRFFEIQYHLPGKKYHQRDRDMLWINRDHFPGHSRWMVQLIRSIRYQTAEGLAQLPEVCRLIMEHTTHAGYARPTCHHRGGHWNLMCTRNCSAGFSLAEIIILLDEGVSNEAVRGLLVESLEQIVALVHEEELLDYIEYLVHHMSTADCAINESILGQWLVRQSSRSVRIANEVYWEMVTRSSSSNNRYANIYLYWLERWVEYVPSNVVNIVLSSRAFSEGCQEVSGTVSSTRGDNSGGYLRHTTTNITNNNSTSPPIMSRQPSSFGAPDAVKSFLRRSEVVLAPTHPEAGAAQVLVDRVRVKQSITRPIAMPLVWIDGNVAGSILFKAEDIRKDHIVMNFIRLCDRILKHELGMDLNIVTYRIRPTSSSAGFIEMVGDSTTMYDIDAEHQCNIFNYVDGKHNLNEIRQRFLQSCAAYCVLTFLLGAGDRHKHNIMITKDGVLFHIDYGYVMGADPKHNPLLPKVPDMRIDRNIADALGPHFREFEELVDAIYNCLRRHVQELTCILRLLVLTDPPIQIKRGFDEKRLMREILKRFAPGEHHEQARIQIINRVHNSTQSTTHYAVVDALHHQAQTNVVLKTLASAWHGVKQTLF